ncbi:MAG: glycosyltransferase family 39 protein [Pseudomonadota bacterium]
MLTLLVLVFAWRILFSHHFNLIPDECSYWAWSRRLDWSYFDNSGMTAYLVRLSTAILGEHTPFSVRLPFLILSAASTWLVYSISLLLFGSTHRALLSALILNLTPLGLLGAAAAMHDNALMFFQLCALWAAARFLRSEDQRWFYVMGASAGASILSKYTGVLVLPCLLLFLLLSPSHRRLVLQPGPWIGALIAGTFMLPIIGWNIAHHWASLNHVLFIGTGSLDWTRRLADGLGYHAAQFIIISPFFYLALTAGLWRACKRNPAHPDPGEILLLVFSFPLLFFGVLAFKGHVEANWASMGYPSAIILAVEMICRADADKKSAFPRFLDPRFRRWALILAVGPVVLTVLHAWIGLLPAALEKKLEKVDRIVWETRGWDGLGRHVRAVTKNGDVIAGDSYQICALLEFNVPGNPYVRYLAPWKRPTQFDVWEPSFDNLAGRNILFVSPQPLAPSSESRASIYENFERVEELPGYGVEYHGNVIRTIHIYRGWNFNPFAPKRLGPRSLKYTRE